MLIGIDGGGTKTTFVLSDETFNIIKRIELGPSSIRTVPFDTSIDTLKKGIRILVESSPSPIRSLFAGIGDVSDLEDAEKVETRLRSIEGLAKSMIRIGNDIECAHAGALDNGHGISVIIGTGSVAYASSDDGTECRIGGYSYKEGDPGSAYAIGRKALSLIGRVHDGRLQDSPLVSELRDRLEAHTFKDIVLLHEAMHENRTKTAGLARLVTTHAKNGDSNAVSVLEEGSDEIALMVKAAMKRVHLSEKRIALIGGLATADSPYREMVVKKIKALDEQLEIIDAKNEPVIGSLYLAYNELS